MRHKRQCVGLLDCFSICKKQSVIHIAYCTSGCWQAEGNEASGVGIDGGVMTGVGDMAFEGGDLGEEGGIGLGVVIKIFVVGQNAA
jgi:hypothetical protein